MKICCQFETTPSQLFFNTSKIQNQLPPSKIESKIIYKKFKPISLKVLQKTFPPK